MDAGFPRPEVQIWVPREGKGAYRLDMGWRKKRIGLEYDGFEYHSDEADHRHDEARRRRLADEFGWHVVGVDRGAVLSRSMELEQGLGQLLGMAPSISRRLW